REIVPPLQGGGVRRGSGLPRALPWAVLFDPFRVDPRKSHVSTARHPKAHQRPTSQMLEEIVKRGAARGNRCAVGTGVGIHVSLGIVAEQVRGAGVGADIGIRLPERPHDTRGSRYWST